MGDYGGVVSEIITQFNQLVYVTTSEQLFLSYDTTFNLGDYVSAIIFKHVLFKETPLIPLAFVIHDRKFGSVHECLFNFLKSTFPKTMKRKSPIVVDREPGIGKAIKNVLPDSPFFFVGIIYVVILSTGYSNCTSDSTKLYLDQFKQMLHCYSADDFAVIYNCLRQYI